MVAVGSLHILAAALQDAGVIVMQHEAQDCPRQGSLHARGLLCGGWLEEDDDHVQGSLYQAGLMAAGANDDGSQVGQGMLLPAGQTGNLSGDGCTFLISCIIWCWVHSFIVLVATSALSGWVHVS